MVSIEFLYFFIPVFMGLYAAAGVKRRRAVFLLGTAALLLWISPLGLIPLTLCTLFSYVFGRLIGSAEKSGAKKLWLFLAVLVNAAAFLLFFRSNYINADITSVVTGGKGVIKLFSAYGAGVFTLHGISYCTDVYRGDIKAEKNFLLTAQYISFFPSLACGPLLRFGDMSEQLRKPVITSDKLAEGIKIMLIGFVEKLLLSNSMFQVWQHIRAVNVQNLSAVCGWLGMIAFSFSFYYELRAYSHIAKGLGLMTGFDIPDNFDLPFMSAGLNEFIKRFCMTLYQWLKDYVYRPLSRRSDKLSLPAMFVAVMIGSMWFGFGRRTLIWAAFICLVLGIEYILKKVLIVIPGAVRCAVMNIVYLIGLPFLAFGNISDACGYIIAMFGGGSFAGDVLALYVVKTSAVMFIICAFFATGIGRFLKKRIDAMSSNITVIIQPLITIGFLLLCTAFLVGGGRQLTNFLF